MTSPLKQLVNNILKIKWISLKIAGFAKKVAITLNQWWWYGMHANKHSFAEMRFQLYVQPKLSFRCMNI